MARRVLKKMAFSLLLTTPGTVLADNSCETLIRRYEVAHGIPHKLLTAISLVESGRKTQSGIVAWPWTINANGKPYVFNSKVEAINMVRKLRQIGVTSIDVGCMQVNLKQHPGAFPTLSAAFDPATNIDYAAKFLKAKKVNQGSWVGAVEHYHSATAKFHIPYRAKVLKTWAKVQNGQMSYIEPTESLEIPFEDFMKHVSKHRGKYVETMDTPSGRRLPVMVQFAPYKGMPENKSSSHVISQASLGRVGAAAKIIHGYKAQTTKGKLIIQKIGATPAENKITVHSVDIEPKFIRVSANTMKFDALRKNQSPKLSKYSAKGRKRK